VNRDIFGRLLHDSRQAQLENQLDLNTRRIVTNARVPQQRFSPILGRNYRIATLAGLGLGILLIIGREQLGDTVETPLEVKERLGLPLLGSVPKDAGGTIQSRFVSSEVLSHRAEAYRMLRTNLVLSSAVGSDRRLLVTSVNPGEGKSTVVTNLAVALAENGARVVAVDADLRRPTLHEKLALANSPGLTELLRDEACLDDVIQAAPIRGLSMIACGQVVPNPVELLGSSRTREALDELASRFEWVLVDVPPILAVAYTTVLTPLVDGVILVIESEKTRRTAVMTAIEQVQDVGGRLIGAVLNKVDLRRSAYTSGQYYGDYYRSDYGVRSQPDDPAAVEPKPRPPRVS